MSTRRLEVVITGDPRSLSRALGTVQRDMGQVDSAGAKVGRRLGILAKSGLFAAGAFAALAAKTGVSELIEQEKVSARTANVLETTGHAANVTAQEVEDLASAIQDQTGTADDAVQGAENLIATFKRVRNEAGEGNRIFDRATRAANDLSVAFEKDLSSSAIMVGKALNDPISGLTALGRVGVQFTRQQKEQIKTLVESGRTLDAQKMILAELESQVGGAASSEGVITEATQQAQRQFEDLTESVAARVVPALVSFGGALRDNAGALTAAGEAAGIAGAGLVAYIGYTKAAGAASGIYAAISAQATQAGSSVTRLAAAQQASAVAGMTAQQVSERQFLRTFGVMTQAQRSTEQYQRTFVNTSTATAAGATTQAGAFARIGVAAKSAGTAVGGFAANAGRALLAMSGGPVGLAIAGITALATAIVIFRDRSSFAGDAVKELNQANRDATAASRSAADAINAQRDALDRLRGAGISVEEANLRVEEATQRVAEAERNAGKGSNEYRRAVLDLKRAELDAGTAKRDRVKATDEGVKATQSASRAARDEVASAQAAVRAAREKAAAVRLGFITGKDAESVTKNLKTAEDRLAKALATSAGKHRENAARARDMAKAAEGAGSKTAGARRQLELLAKTELSTAAQVAAIRAIGSAADSVSGGVAHLIDLVRQASSGPDLTTRIRAAGRGARSKSAKELGGSGLSFPLRRVPTGSPTDLARTTARGDTTARTARLNAEDTARAAGKSEDEIREAGERAAITARRANIGRLKVKIKARRKTLVGQLKKCDISARRQIKVPGPKSPKKRKDALDRRAALKQKENEIRDELETLAADWADLTVEFRELGGDLAELDRGDEAGSDTGSDAGADTGPTQGDFLGAAAAEAALTPGLEDDLAAAQAIEAAAQADLDAARASGDPRRVEQAARDLLAARQNREQIQATMANTDALNANTDAIKQSFGGSVAFDYRGQPFVLGSLAPPSSDRLVGMEVGI